MADRLAEEVARLQARILTLLKHVPDSVINGSYNRAHDYKAAVKKAKEDLQKQKKNYIDLQMACNALEYFEKPVPLTTEESAS